MSWADYHLDDPTFCKPMVVAEGLLRALFERQRASYIAQHGGGWYWTLDEYRDRIFPDMFTKTDVLSVKTFCRNFDGYLALFAWTNGNILECPIANPFGPLGACARTCQYYPWHGQENTCPGHQYTCVDANGELYTLRSLLDDIGDEELIDASHLNINQPSLYVPWALQRVKMLKKLRRFKDDNPALVLTTEEAYWSEYDSPYHTRQDAVDAVPREIVTDTYYSNQGMECWTEMSAGDCISVELTLPMSAAPYYDEELPDELKPRSGWLVINVDDPFIGTFHPLNAPVTKGLNRFELDSDGTFFHWPTRITLPAGLPEEGIVPLGWGMQRKYAVYDFNSTFEFQE